VISLQLFHSTSFKATAFHFTLPVLPKKVEALYSEFSHPPANLMCIIVNLYACGDYRWHEAFEPCHHSISDGSPHQIVLMEQKCPLCERIILLEGRYQQEEEELAHFKQLTAEICEVIMGNKEFERFADGTGIFKSVDDDGTRLSKSYWALCRKKEESLAEKRKFIDNMRCQRQKSLMGPCHDEETEVEHALQQLMIMKFGANEMLSLLVDDEA
jgi:hypothetical protein